MVNRSNQAKAWPTVRVACDQWYISMAQRWSSLAVHLESMRDLVIRINDENVTNNWAGFPGSNVRRPWIVFISTDEGRSTIIIDHI